MSTDWTPPNWMFRGEKPPNDKAYFENLIRCIFQAGLNWRVISNKWPFFIKAFDNFDLDIIAGYDEKKVNELLENKKIIRNKRKILATIENAKEFKRIIKDSGSFQNWLEEQDTTNNYSSVKKQLSKKLKHVGDTTAHIFLYTVGEDIKRE
jgi:DNA-3-methyladenine glycosylase I